MFQSITRTMMGAPGGGTRCIVTLRDTCFTSDFFDTICPCPYNNCAATCLHLIREYSSRNLNVVTNLCKYFWWLGYSGGYSLAEELHCHDIYLSRYHPLTQFNQKYGKVVKNRINPPR